MDPWGHATWVGMVSHIKKIHGQTIDGLMMMMMMMMMTMSVYIKEKLINVFVVCEDVDTKTRRRRIAFDGLGKEEMEELDEVLISVTASPYGSFSQYMVDLQRCFHYNCTLDQRCGTPFSRNQWRCGTQECSTIKAEKFLHI